MEDENEDNKAGVDSETGRGDQSHALQHWGRHMTERRRQQDLISRESVSRITQSQGGECVLQAVKINVHT